MPPTPNIASLSLDAVRATGEKFVLELAIGAPFISERHQTWACSLTLHPIFAGPQEVAGADSVQALSLALRAARSLLEDFTEKGGKLLLDGEAFPIEAEDFTEKGGKLLLDGEAFPIEAWLGPKL